jgi:hypothetical protein
LGKFVVTITAEDFKTIGVVILLFTTFGGVAGVWAVLRSDTSSLKKKDEKREAELSSLKDEFSHFREHAAGNFVTYKALSEVKIEVVGEVQRLGDRIDKMVTEIIKGR